MTWSIVAKDPETGAFGVAVTTCSLAVGGICPYGSGRIGALSTQARFNPLYGIDGIRLLAEGRSATEVVSLLTAGDGGRENRQIHVIDAAGVVGQHTGQKCVDWAGHVAGEGVSVAGNMLAGPLVVAATLEAYQIARDVSFADRLLLALDAGQAAGGDKRGRQSAAIKIWHSEPYPVVDLRTDDHTEPLVELRRLYELAEARYLPTVATLATRENPAGIFDDAERNRVMKQYRRFTS